MSGNKQPVARLYTDRRKYMGWQRINNNTYGEIVNWIRSGNMVRIGCVEYNRKNEVSCMRRMIKIAFTKTEG